ncbi:MAG: hypothetical protein ACP5UJ_07505 [Athalassotoga sp.]|uniref:hypothetical protein n=1 Tax=Athalassotoga sp. TaxID=2022597 RepID=UPI003D00B637
MKILVDDSIDVKGVEKIPLYIEWKSGKLRVSEIDRRSYFSLNKKSAIVLPTFDELNEVVSKLVPVKIFLPSRPFSFLKDELTFLSSLIDGISIIEEKMDAVTLSLFLNSGISIDNDIVFARSATTYLLFSDLSFLRKNDVISERKASMIITKMINIVKFGFGRTVVKSMWSLKNAVSSIIEEIDKPSSIILRYSGREKTVESITKEFSKKFGSRVSSDFMNPALASIYGHDTLTITVISEEKNG